MPAARELGVNGFVALPVEGALEGRPLDPTPRPSPAPPLTGAAEAAAYGGGKSGILRCAGVGTGDLPTI